MSESVIEKVEKRMRESRAAIDSVFAKQFEPVFLTVEIRGGKVTREVSALQRADVPWRAWDSRRWWQRLAFWRRPPSDARLTVEELIALRAYESEARMKALAALASLFDRPWHGKITGWTA